MKKIREEETQSDPYHGVGGAYVVDPKTGKRIPDKAAQPSTTHAPPSDADADAEE